MTFFSFRNACLTAISALSSAFLLSGCGGVLFSPSAPISSVPGTAMTGQVHGGQQPISDAHVYLYAANITGMGNTSVSLLNSGGSNTFIDSNSNYYVKTDSGGNFSISGDYTCPSTVSQVYLYSVGGDSGSGTNSAATLMAALGTCPASGTLSSSLYVVINEVSTIATAYSLGGYATSPTHVSSSGSSLAVTDVANAFATVTNLETLDTGTALATTPAGNGTVPQGQINTLANILAACINSSGTVTGPANPTPCYTLFNNALSAGTTGTVPTDTATAALNLAHNPGVVNIASLFALQGATPPFQTALTAAPTDLTIPITYLGDDFSFPEYLAIDASGNVWVTNGQGYYTLFGSVSELSNTGVPLNQIGYFGFGMAYPYGIAIDPTGNVWTANLAGTVSKISANGTILNPTGLSGSGFTAGGLTSGFGIAIDKSGNVWAGCSNGSDSGEQINTAFVVGRGNCLVEFDSSGNALSGANGYTGASLSGPAGVAVDPAGHIWVANSYSNNLSEFSATGSPIAGYGGGGLLVPYGIAIGPGPLVWAANLGNSTWSLFSDTGTAYSGYPAFSGGGVTAPFNMALDGTGNIWLPSTTGTIAEFNSSGALSGTAGFSSGDTRGYVSVAIDGSGNVWGLRLEGGGGTNLGSLTEFVGAAVPVVTPVVANLLPPYAANSSAVNIP